MSETEEKWREAGWSSPDDVLTALTALQLRVREVRDGFKPMIDQGSGAYLNPRVVVDRLDAALAGRPPAPADAALRAECDVLRERLARAEAMLAQRWDPGVVEALRRVQGEVCWCGGAVGPRVPGDPRGMGCLDDITHGPDDERTSG
jgi:hypothetical protein